MIFNILNQVITDIGYILLETKFKTNKIKSDL